MLALFIGGILILLQLKNRRVIKNLVSPREPKEIDKVYEEYFGNLEKDEFVSIWKNISSVLEVSPELLRPDDTLNSLSKDIHLHEMYFEKMENYLRKLGVEPSTVSIDKPVGDIVNMICSNGYLR